MSFLFPSWSTAFSESFYDDAKKMLETALNKGNKPPVIQGRIEVVDLNMGTQPPTLTLLEIGDLSLDRFRGILRLGYQGDAWIEVRCRVQANPLSHNPNLVPSSTLPISTPLLASQPLLVPMTLRLSKLHLRAILILVVSASKGITLVFKNDPLQNVDVSSTFDSVEVIRGYLQQEIEGQLREMFREDLPGIIHRLSQRWFTGSGTAGHVETPYRDADPAPAPSPYDEDEPYDPTAAGEDIFGPAHPLRSSENSTPRRRVHRVPSQTIRTAGTSVGNSNNAMSSSPTSYTVFPDIENYDPTYGLRPEGLPTHSGYEAFGRVWERARVGRGRGLGSLMDDATSPDPDSSFEEEDSYGLEDDGTGSVHSDHLDLDMDDVPRMSTPQRSHATSVADSMEWETFPAVGGGLITRPRVFHSQSQIRAPSESGFGPAMPSPAGTAGTATGSVTARASSVGDTSTIGSLRGRQPATATALGYTHAPLRRTNSAATSEGQQNRPVRAGSESLAAYAMQQHALGRGSTSPHAAFHGRRAGSPGLVRTRSNWDSPDDSHSHVHNLASPPLGRPRPLSADAHYARQRSQTSLPAPAPQRPRERTTSFGTTTGVVSARVPLAGITLPMNNSVSQLATLSLSANTLSPYARAHEHIAVRSFPYLGRAPAAGAAGGGSSASPPIDNSNVKARRKRIFRLGGNKSQAPAPLPEADEPTPPLDWDTETRPASSSSESQSRWRNSVPASLVASGSQPRSRAQSAAQQSLGARSHSLSIAGGASSRGSYGFPKIPE